MEERVIKLKRRKGRKRKESFPSFFVYYKLSREPVIVSSFILSFFDRF